MAILPVAPRLSTALSFSHPLPPSRIVRFSIPLLTYISIPHRHTRYSFPFPILALCHPLFLTFLLAVPIFGYLQLPCVPIPTPLRLPQVPRGSHPQHSPNNYVPSYLILYALFQTPKSLSSPRFSTIFPILSSHQNLVSIQCLSTPWHRVLVASALRPPARSCIPPHTRGSTRTSPCRMPCQTS